MDFIVSFDGIGPSSGLALCLWLLFGVALIAVAFGFWSWFPVDRFMADRTSNAVAVSLFAGGVLAFVIPLTLYTIDVMKFRGEIEEALGTKVDGTTLGLPTRGVETKMVLSSNNGFVDCKASRLDEASDTLVRVQFFCTPRD